MDNNLLINISVSNRLYDYTYSIDKYYNTAFVSNLFSDYLSLDNRNILLEKINNGRYHSCLFNNNKINIFTANSVNNNLLNGYTTIEKWRNYHLDILSGDYFHVDSIVPQVEFISNSCYYYLDNISYINNYSIEKYANGLLESGYYFNKRTNDIAIQENNLLFGGLPQDNNIFINYYDIKNMFYYDIHIFDEFWSTLSSGYLVEPIYNQPLTKNYSVSQFKSSYNLEITPNQLVHINGNFDSNNMIGNIIFNCQFLHGFAKGITDFIPEGYKYITGFNNLIPNNNFNNFIFHSYNNLYSSSIFSDVIINISGNIDAINLENILSPLSPYGVKCYGSNLSNMYILVNGNIDSNNINNGLIRQNVNYNFVRLNMSILENHLFSPLISHGAISVSGQLIWSDNHGQELIQYNEYIGTGIVSNLYQAPNHLGEIYSIDYNKEKNKAIFTGNLVNSFTTKKTEYKLMESGVNLYDNSGFIIDSYVNYIPTGQILSNGSYNSIIQSSFNKRSLQYTQTQTSNLICGEDLLIPSSLLFYTGIYPNFNIGVVMSNPIYIYTTGVQ